MNKHSNRRHALVPLAGALAIVVTGIALASATALAARAAVHATAYRLTATLTPAQEVPAVQAPSGAVGHFHGVLFMTGPGAVKIATLAGCKVVIPPRRSGLPTRINCNGATGTLPSAPGQWRLLWQLRVSGLSSAVTRADIHLASIGQAAPPAFTLCGPCGTIAHGMLAVTAGQATSLVGNSSYVNVATVANPGGEIRGQITMTKIGLALGQG